MNSKAGAFGIAFGISLLVSFVMALVTGAGMFMLMVIMNGMTTRQADPVFIGFLACIGMVNLGLSSLLGWLAIRAKTGGAAGCLGALASSFIAMLLVYGCGVALIWGRL